MDLETAIRKSRVEMDASEVRRQVGEGAVRVAQSSDATAFWAVRRSALFDAPVFWIYLAYGSGDGLVQKYEPQIVALARMCGCGYVMFRAARRGWRRHLSPCWREIEPGVFVRSAEQAPLPASNTEMMEVRDGVWS